jgi:hypothetical protein
MKIEYRTAGGSTYSVLADDSVTTLAAAISGFQPVASKSPMQMPAYGATNPVTQDLGNMNWRLSFTVDRFHATADAAAAFIAAEPLKFPGNVDLKFTIGAQVTYLANTALSGFTPDPHSDQSTRITYAFTGGNYTTTAP